MTQEEKQLLLTDLCERIPYQPLCKRTDTEDTFCECDCPLGYSLRDLVGNRAIIKPYLRPMSSMTKKEKEDLCNSCTWLWFKDDLRTVTHGDYKCYDWLNAHHFDYRGLIEKGLALEVSENIY